MSGGGLDFTGDIYDVCSAGMITLENWRGGGMSFQVLPTYN